MSLPRRLGATLSVVALSAVALAGSVGAEVPVSVPAGAAEAESVANLVIIEPGAAIQREGKTEFKPAKDGAKLRVGDTLQTDATGFAQVNYTDDSFTRLDVNTTFTINSLTDDQGNRQIEGSLDSGRAWNRTSALTESESFEQEGAGATAAVVGTAFFVTCTSANNCVFTSVVDGVELTTVDGEVQSLDPLQECDATEVDPTNANLCGSPSPVTVDALIADGWLGMNIFLDVLAGYPGPVEVQGLVVVEGGEVTSFTPTPLVVLPPAPVIPASPVNVKFPGGDPAPGVEAGPANSVVSQDERNDVTFILQIANPGGGAAWIMFTDLPSHAFGQLLAAGVAVDTVTQYPGGTVYTFDPVEFEPICDEDPTVLADCFTNGDAAVQDDPEQPDTGPQLYPSPVVDNGDGTVSWFDTFSFVAQNDQGGQSPVVTVTLEAVDDICLPGGDEGGREAEAVVPFCNSNV